MILGPVRNSNLPYPPAIPKEFELTQAWIPKYNMSKLSEKIGKMQRKASKLGLSSITFNILDEGIFSIDIADNRGLYAVSRRDSAHYVKVEIIGEAVKLPGWNLVAVLEHERLDATKITDDESITNVNIVRVVPGMELDTKYRFVDSFCEHCSSHRYRSKTFVLRQDGGEEKQVGSSCVKDFLGHVSPETIMGQAKWVEILSRFLGEYREPGTGWVPEDEILEVLAWTNVAINKFGWVSKGKAMETNSPATAPQVQEQIDILNGRQYPYKEFVQWDAPTEDDYKFAQDAIDWITGHDINEASDYVFNCLAIAKSGAVRQREYGIACSIVGSYKGHLAKLAGWEREKKKELYHVGIVGGNFQEELTFVKEIVFSGFYGVGAFIHFADTNGNIIIWKTSPKGLTEGAKYKVAGKIKEHSQFNNQPQTVITRCKIEEVA